CGPGLWQTVGGTSLGAPAWAAIIAIADQGRALSGKGSLDGPTQTLPALYALASTDFHTIALPPLSSPWGGGVNPIGSFPFGSGSFALARNPSGTGPRRGVARGANTVTGRGSPNAPALIPDLVASNLTTRLQAARTPLTARGPSAALRTQDTSPLRTSHP